MQQPSRISIKLAEEIREHVGYGLTPGDVIKEWAEIIDEGQTGLLDAAHRLLQIADGTGSLPDEAYLRELRATLADHNFKTPPTARLTGVW